ncbi:MAG: site-specific integrase [Desulfococcaceae bacterium]|jgi:site-specific recombinase XerD|nr:site-specific integrase [Desulfococcaceae bacterium]
MAKVLRTKWYGETVKALQINGKSRRTQECYARAVRMLTEYSGKEPDEITEEEIRDYFLYRKNECGWVPDTMKICYCGILFFYGHVIRRDRHIFSILKSEKEKRLPCVLSRKEVYNILSHVRTFHNYTYLTTLYACGLRLQEALYLRYPILIRIGCRFTFTGAKGPVTAMFPARRNPASAPPLLGNPPESPADFPGFGTGAYFGAPV